ncbi:hypothetical protein Tco_0679368 [Tanacetum coccineum]|uniref:Zinc knuckle CX2CX4HX4C n=1 Tax=Tanacetum coccineum TaxID=301880 RepID=A0ABQ4XHN7_9ASTR
MILDSYTTTTCMDSWGMASYARPMVELRADVELKNTTVVVVPKFVGEEYTMRTICVEYEWTLPRCSSCRVFGHVLDECPKKSVSDVAKNLKNPRQVQYGLSRQEVSNSNPFDALNSVENDDDLGTNEGNSKLAEKGANSGVVSSAHGQLFDKKRMLVDDDGKPIHKVDPVNSDSDNEFEVAYDKTAQFMASGGANDANLYEEEDYDIYDTYDIEGLSKQELAFSNRMDINLRGRSKDSLCLVYLRVKCKLVSMWSFPLI